MFLSNYIFVRIIKTIKLVTAKNSKNNWMENLTMVFDLVNVKYGKQFM